MLYLALGKNRASVPAIASEFCPALRPGITGCRFTCAQAWHCRGHDRVRRRRQRGRKIRPKRRIEPPLLPRRHPDDRDLAELVGSPRDGLRIDIFETWLAR